MDGRILCLVVLVSLQLCTSVWSAAVPLSTLPKSTHAKLLMDVVRLLSGSEPSAAQDGADKTGHQCQLKEASKCFNDALGKFYKSLLNDDVTDTKRSICSLANDLDICNSALQRPECRLRETLTFDAINKGSRYFCTLQGYNNYLGLKPCLSHAHVVTELKECKQKLAVSPTDTDDCKLFDAYVNCAVESTKASCAANIEDTLKESLTVLLLPYREAICPVSQSEAGHVKGNPLMPIKSMPSRTRREAEDFGSFFGGSAFDGLTGAFSPTDLFGGEMPALTGFSMPGSSSGEAGSTQETASPGFNWEQLARQSSTFSNPEFLELLQRLSQLSGQGAGSSEEVSTMPTDVVTQEANSEEVTMIPPENTTPEISSEEVNTAAPGATTQPDSSEEVSTASQDTTPQPDSSEEISTSSPDTTTEPDSSEEETTSSLDTTPQPDSSEEVSTTSPDVTPQEPNSEEEPATTPATTTTAGTNSEEVTPSLPETTPPTPLPLTPAPEVETTTNPPAAPPTTQKSHHVAPFHCYECHSGTVGYWVNPMCPSNGKIHGWAALPVDCEGPCVSVVTKFPKGEVYRACSSNYYFPFRVPHDGCLRHNQELYCFCSGDFCNNRDMVADQQAFILTGLITKY